MRRLSAAAVTLTAAISLAACGSNSSGGSSSGGSAPSTDPSTNPTAAKAAVAHLYTTFFSSPIPVAKTMLQDGANLSQAFTIANRLKAGATESAKVKSVTLNPDNTASVTFELDADGNKVIPSSDGQAVYINGKWLVSKTTFCNLVSLGAPNVPGC